MVSRRAQFLTPFCSSFCINDFNNLFSVHLFADDSNLFLADLSLESLETSVNRVMVNAQNWLCANKLCFTIDQTNYILFHAAQKKVTIKVNKKEKVYQTEGSYQIPWNYFRLPS